VLLLIVFGIMLKIYLSMNGAPRMHSSAAPLLYLLLSSVTINLVLAIFNLIPVPPLDGSHVIRHFLSGSELATYDRLGTYGLMLLFIANWYFNFLGYLFRPAYVLIDRVFLS
jgi:Zn-dependent protease